MAKCYEAEIFSVLEHDRANLISRKVRRYGKKRQTATDVGCGIGHFLPLLSAQFQKVVALDLSSQCIARAQARFPHLANVSYRAGDLAAAGVRLPKTDFALCVNVAIAPAIAQRNRLLDATCRSLRPGGHLVLVVPSLESSFLTDFRLIEWNLRDGLAPRRAAGAGGPGQIGEAVDAAGGEAFGQLALLGGENVDGVVRASAEDRHRAGLQPQAPQHQRRRHRHRVEGIGGQADRRAVFRAGGDDGDAGGEQAERGSEILSGERCSLHGRAL